MVGKSPATMGFSLLNFWSFWGVKWRVPPFKETSLYSQTCLNVWYIWGACRNTGNDSWVKYSFRNEGSPFSKQPSWTPLFQQCLGRTHGMFIPIYFAIFNKKFTIPGKQVVLISINFIPNSSHSCLTKWHTLLSRCIGVFGIWFYILSDGWPNREFPGVSLDESEVPTSPWLWMDTFATTPAFASCSFHCAAASDQHRSAGWSEGRSFHWFFFSVNLLLFLPG